MYFLPAYLLRAVAASSRSTAAYLDLASVEMSDGWSANLATGDASFDDFVHDPNNPVYTGSGNEQWQVKS